LEIVVLSKVVKGNYHSPLFRERFLGGGRKGFAVKDKSLAVWPVAKCREKKMPSGV